MASNMGLNRSIVSIVTVTHMHLYWFRRWIGLPRLAPIVIALLQKSLRKSPAPTQSRIARVAIMRSTAKFRIALSAMVFLITKSR